MYRLHKVERDREPEFQIMMRVITREANSSVKGGRKRAGNTVGFRLDYRYSAPQSPIVAMSLSPFDLAKTA